MERKKLFGHTENPWSPEAVQARVERAKRLERIRALMAARGMEVIEGQTEDEAFLQRTVEAGREMFFTSAMHEETQRGRPGGGEAGFHLVKNPTFEQEGIDPRARHYGYEEVESNVGNFTVKRFVYPDPDDPDSGSPVDDLGWYR